MIQKFFHPVRAFLCPIAIWAILAILLWSVWSALRDGVAQLKRLHQIPCSRCAFFTGDYRLKCTVHPYKALTEAAIDCLDYEPTVLRSTITYSTTCSKQCKRSVQR
ncbi:MAG: hypothetical protein HC769_10680 [Cyanobacteria bacterium CRU_2_1]|nr:hypothetical protein [Cyanobacteria bacterium RU_5_0]NJR59266.1 hypothetical protein [Cyanobacteria bacterium CRU_2_1]